MVTFIVEDGTGISDATSGVTLEWADAHLAASGYADDWALIVNDDRRKELLNTATLLVSNSFSFRGTLLWQTQSLPFPRKDLRDREDRLILGVPMLYKSAIAEVAYVISQENYTEDSELSALKSIKVGPISLETSAMASESKVIPDFVIRLLSEYGSYRFSRMRMRTLIAG